MLPSYSLYLLPIQLVPIRVRLVGHWWLFSSPSQKEYWRVDTSLSYPRSQSLIFSQEMIVLQLMKRQAALFLSARLTTRSLRQWQTVHTDVLTDRTNTGLALWHWSLTLQMKVRHIVICTAILLYKSFILTVDLAFLS